MGWIYKELNQVCEILDKRRKPITKKNRVPGPYPYYGASGVLDYVDDFIFDEELVLLGEDGAKWGAGENSAFSISGKTWVNNHAHVLRPNREKILDSWLIYYLNASDLNPFISGMTVPKLNQGRLKEIEIPIPPVEEQKRTVAILDEAFADIDKARALTERNLENARELFQSALNQAFSNENGCDWLSSELCQHIKFIDYRGKTPKKIESGLKLITAKNVRMGYLKNEPEEFVSEESYDDWMTRGIPRKGDVLFTTEAPLANVAQLNTDEKVVFAQRIITMQPDRTILNDCFLKYLLMSPSVQKRIHEKGTGATATGIKASLLKRIIIRFPGDLEHQERIAKGLNAISEQSEKLSYLYNRKLENLESLRRSLLQKAFTGELTKAAG